MQGKHTPSSTRIGTFLKRNAPPHTHTPLCRKLSKPTCEAEFEAGLVQWIECQPTWSPAFGGSLCLSFILRQILGESWGRDNILCSNTGRGARVIESRIMGGEISNLISSNYTSILASPSDKYISFRRFSVAAAAWSDKHELYSISQRRR